MTANEMADELELRLDRSYTYGSPGYEDFELSSALTQAQSHYVKSFYSEKNNRKGYGFEESEVRNQGLAELLSSSVNPLSSDQTGVLTNGFYYDLPLDFMYTVYEEVEIDAKDCDNNNIIADVKVISHDEIRKLKGNKYKKPSVNLTEPRIWRTQYSRNINTSSPTVAATNKRHQLITDGIYNIVNYKMNYLINPPEINVDRNTINNQKSCILDESTHEIIIDIARDILLGIVKEQKLQTEIDQKDLE